VRQWLFTPYRRTPLKIWALLPSIRGKPLGVNDVAAEDHVDNCRVGANRLRWIFAKQQQVGALPNLHRPDLIVESKGFCVGQCGRLKYLVGPYAGVDQPLHFEPSVEAGWIGVGGSACSIRSKQQARVMFRQILRCSLDSAN